MHATWNQSSIMQPQINTREQSRVNQNPIAYMTKNDIPFGIHNAFFLDVLASKTGKGWLSVTATPPLINFLICSVWTHWLAKSPSYKKKKDSSLLLYYQCWD